jgi:hypothetical protein
MTTGGYKYIEDYQETSPIALYGVSGAGKTRTIFEYLSHIFGFYLSAGADALHNPGTEDVKMLIAHYCKSSMRVIEIPKKCTEEQVKTLKISSEANLMTVQNLLKALLHVRQEVFRQVERVLASKGQQGLTCYDWLLLQLFPKEFLGCDIFLEVFRKIVSCDLRYEDRAPAPKQNVFSCFLDETQVLLKQLKACSCPQKQRHLGRLTLHSSKVFRTYAWWKGQSIFHVLVGPECLLSSTKTRQILRWPNRI